MTMNGAIRTRRVAAVVWIGMASAGFCQVTVQDFTNGVPFSNMVGWAAEPAGVASVPPDLDPLGAAGALRLNATNLPARVTRGVLEAELGPWLGGTSTVAFADLWVRPVADPPTNAAACVAVDGARVGFVLDGSVGRAFVFDGDGQGGGAAQDTGYVFPVGAGGASSNWVRLTIRRDFASPQFDAWMDGSLYAVGAGPDETNVQTGPAFFELEGNENAAIWLDLYSLDPDNPLFPDADRDGMPDDFEASRGLNPALDDRDSDPDGDGAANIGEYAMGTAPDDGRSYPGATGVALFYVDGDLGDDLSNGLAAHPSAAGGPKRTFGAGLDVAGASGAPAATVVIRESTNAYLEGFLGAGSNTVTVRPIGEVLVRP